MEKEIQRNRRETDTLAEDARALLTATAHVAGDKVENARQRLAAALESGKHLCGKAREKVVEGAKATDKAIHEHPYQAIGTAVVAGALLGYLVALRCSRNDD